LPPNYLMRSLAFTVATERAALELVHHPELTLLLDLDGTLIPFAATPEAAILDREAIAIISSLSSAGIRVVIVSGRPRCMVEPLRGELPNIRWMAEHGSWRCDEAGTWSGPADAPELGELLAMLQHFAMVPGVRLEMKSLSVCLHWRLVPQVLKDELVANAKVASTRWLAAHPAFERLDGVEMIEIRRRSSNKSRAVAWVREHAATARIIAIGDDHTDEDMFAALLDSELAISAGRIESRASCSLDGPFAVRAFLRWLVEIRTTRK
jgi:trehalose-phosphatase